MRYALQLDLVDEAGGVHRVQIRPDVLGRFYATEGDVILATSFQTLDQLLHALLDPERAPAGPAPAWGRSVGSG